ncbi:MAG TPA: S41 family peptidase [bacterium]|jgi:carboxyl-terminal processing protease|nr:S41 family peptidase [bacterium]HNZ51237.1 S41 family peptidase [bacterium]HOF79720.1 S41 family peptidase [bacterium]HOH85132.1 S41 family peptidase [bacterium]HOQ91548.1 S41 family peptidase [bacterium]
MFQRRSTKCWGRFLGWLFLVAIIASGGFLFGLFYGQRAELARRLSDSQAVFLGRLTGIYQQDQQGRLISDIDFSLFWQTWDLIKANYVDQDKLTDKQMFYGALSGLVSSVDDPYTVFMNPEESKLFNEDLTGTFSGIGAEVGLRNDVITIIAPLAGTPAERAGLRSGDKVYAIDKQSTVGLTVDEAVKKIRGEKGTTVILTIARNGDKLRDISITRDTIVVKSVATDYDQTSGLYTITVSNFNADTEPLFQAAVQDIEHQKPRGLILDLRNNPGGYLDAAVAIASFWISDGVIVSEQFSNQSAIQSQHARGLAPLADLPTVVLINQGSASASEIVAGALMDHQQATIIGKTTYGKGSVQVVRDLPDGSMIKITTAKWLTPNGTSINDKGIKPNIEVELTEDDFNKNIDPQMVKARQFLLQEDK